MLFYSFAMLAAALLAGAVVAAPIPTAAAILGAVLVGLGWRTPRLAFVVWIIAGVAVPYWLAIPAGVIIPPLTAVSLPIIIGLAVRVKRWVVTGVDWLMLALIASAALAVMVGAELSSGKDVFLVWGSAYAAGRLFALRIDKDFFSRVYVTAGIAVALWAVAEFALSLHVFEHVSGPVKAIAFWNTIQTRGSFDRSEAAFGHSICLAAFLVTVVPFILKTRRPTLGWIILCLGIAASLSRAGFIGLAAAVVLCLFAYGLNRRLFIVSLLATGGALLYAPDILFGTDDAAAQQIGWSTNYREYLWETGFAQIKGIGPSEMYFRTVDHAFLRIGLDLGWASLALFTVLALIPLFRVIFRRTKEPAEIALAASFPILLTVALLLQWQSFLFMLGGVAVSVAVAGRPSEKSRESLPSPAYRAVAVTVPPFATAMR